MGKVEEPYETAVLILKSSDPGKFFMFRLLRKVLLSDISSNLLVTS